MSVLIKKILKKTPISELKFREPVCVTKNTPIAKVISAMRAKKRGSVMVIQKKKIIGIFTERDLIRRVIGPQIPLTTPIQKVMSTKPACLKTSCTVADTIKIMNKRGVRHMPLVDKKGSAKGYISTRDLLDYLAEHFPIEVYNVPPNPLQINQEAEGA